MPPSARPSHSTPDLPGVRYLSRREAAAKLSCSERWLERLALEGGGPPLCRLGRSVRYREDLIDQWAAGLMIESTSQAAA